MSSEKTRRAERSPIDRGWQFRASDWPTPPERFGYSKMQWFDAQVPGQVHVDLQRSGVIADPHRASHELGCRWIDETGWIYRTRFRLESDPARPRRSLCFAGLDTVCEVFVDGERRAFHDNMFVPLELDVSDLAEGEHELSVEFASAARVGRERRARYFASEGLAESTLRFDELAFVRKAQYMFGWDWGPRLISAGVYLPVTLTQFAARLLDVRVTQRHSASGRVTLQLQSTFDGEGRVQHTLTGPKGEALGGPLGDGQSFEIASPELWWPAGLGAQPLYAIESLLLPRENRTDDTSALAGIDASIERALDVRRTRVGLRRIELCQQPDQWGHSFEFVVNGKPIYALGANWIPDHSMPSLVDRARLRAQLLRARDLGMNMLRIWGGGLYESDDFYDLCDELGLLVWQDFTYACSYYPDDTAALRVADQEARVQITRLRNHASLALWCGNNENHEMFDKGWEGRERHPARFYGQRIYSEVLPRAVSELDPERPYIESSPLGGAQPNDGGSGDQHYWDVWHGRGDWVHYRDSGARFCSEFGFASAPGHATWRQIAEGALELPPDHALCRWHDKTLKGTETFLSYVELHYPRSNDVEEWAYHSQLNQRDALRFAIEHYRRSAFCRGALIWQLNDCWPAQSWAVIDFAGEYKAAAFELRRLYAPELLSLDVQDGRARVWLCVDNMGGDTPSETKTLTLQATSTLAGEPCARWEAQVRASEGLRQLVLDVDVAALPRQQTLLTASLGRVHTHRLLAEPKDCHFCAPRVRVRQRGAQLEIESETPLVDLFVFDPRGQAKLSHNFVTLPSPGQVQLGVEGRLATLGVRHLGGAARVPVEHVQT